MGRGWWSQPLDHSPSCGPGEPEGRSCGHLRTRSALKERTWDVNKGPMSGPLLPIGLLRPYCVPARTGAKMHRQTCEVPAPRSRCLEWGGRKAQVNRHPWEHPRWERCWKTVNRVTIYRLAQGPGSDSAHGMGGSVKVFLRQGIWAEPRKEDRVVSSACEGGEGSREEQTHLT